MCDTLYCALHNKGSPSKAFFGKNSDRHPAEAQTLCIVGRRQSADSSLLGERRFPLADAGLSFLLSKPSWMAGGEMGINEKGVAIGNEAVFSRFKKVKDGVLGMDILRFALGSSATAKEAVDFICRFVEAYDQGGNGAYRGSLYYDNSFIIADPSEAYVLETAGRRWAWRAAEKREAISNAYAIEEDYKRLDAQTRKEIAPVNERAACSDEADPGRKGSKESFKAHVEKRLFLRFTKGEIRRKLSLSLLDGFYKNLESPGEAAEGAVAKPSPLLGFLDILRSHGEYDPSKPKRQHMESLCIHPGGLPATATTASFAVDYRGEDSAIIWFTGTSTPCLSLYKPLLLYKGEFKTLWTDYDYSEGAEGSEAYWRRWKDWEDRFKKHRRGEDKAYAAALAQAQEALALIAEKALYDLAASKESSSLPVLRQEAGAVLSGWEKDLGL
ncbi:MAG: carcinine hydrolase/isopenicillin-N N-acyltransferase family protein [Spirochaetia bacterium]|jgi:dipeptidase|nr:carcinine hydrolase/isopenicillin-N N-acyltransferase family protein [Spirochaetia bacterium]